MKRVCFFYSNMSSKGGTVRCTSLIANAISENSDMEVFIVDIKNDNDKVTFPLNKEIKYHSLNMKGILRNILALRKYIIANKIDILISVQAMMGIYSLPAALFTRTKQIIWEHGNFYQKQSSKIDLVRWLEFKLCDMYITLTEKDKNTFQKYFSGKCTVDYIYNPVILPKSEAKYNRTSKKIISVGIIRKIKGFDMLVDVAKIVLKRYPDWTWEIYGDKTSFIKDVEEIEHKIKSNYLEDKLILSGNIEEIESMYQNSGLIVMTSRMEGLPMTLLEAKANKLPIISFDIQTGPSEIIQNGENGYLIQPFDLKSMADKICDLLGDTDLRQSFSNKSYNDINKFSLEKITEKWIDVIKSV